MSTDPEALIAQALAAFQARRRPQAGGDLRALVAAAPPLGERWASIGRMAKAIGEAGAAIGALRLRAAAAGDALSAQLELGDALAEFGRIDEAIALGEELAARFPRQAATHHYLGTVLSQRGRAEPALAALRAALAIEPSSPETWHTLAHLKRFAADDEELARLRAVLSRAAALPGPARGTLLYALGKALEDAGEPDAAFAAFAEGAALIGAARSFDHRAETQWLEQVRARMDQRFFAALQPSQPQGARAVFVVGLPRSGTTLMEQILAAHSEVADGAESAQFRNAAMALPDGGPDSMLRCDGPQAWTELARDYRHLLAERFGPAGRVVDKTLTHTHWLGVIAHALPDARVIWMRRHPEAAAWSCFRTRFARGSNWSWSFEGVAAHMRVVDAAHAHWSALFADRILTVAYEDLVLAPDVWIPRALAHAGLADEPGTRAFHRLDRAVQTSSVAQVREPLNRAGLDNWRPHEARLAPFRAAYRG